MRHSKARLWPRSRSAGALSLTAACSSGGGERRRQSTSAAKQGAGPELRSGHRRGLRGPGRRRRRAPSRAAPSTTWTRPASTTWTRRQQYVSDQLSISPLFARTLTGYKIDPKTGKTILVGDLATDTGKMSDGGKTWTYTLKSGLKFQDGTPITSQDVKYGIERLYADFETAGPAVPPDLAVRPRTTARLYPGPYGGKSIPDSMLATPDDKTIVFHFQHPARRRPVRDGDARRRPRCEKSKDDQGRVQQPPGLLRPVPDRVLQARQVAGLQAQPELGPEDRPDPQRVPRLVELPAGHRAAGPDAAADGRAPARTRTRSTCSCSPTRRR